MADPRMAVFGGRVLMARKDRGLSQRQLACLIGCDHGTIGTVERASHFASLPLALDLASELGLSLDDLMTVVTVDG